LGRLHAESAEGFAEDAEKSDEEMKRRMTNFD